MSYKEKSIAYFSCFAIAIMGYYNMENTNQTNNISNTIEMNQNIDADNHNDELALLIDAV